MRKVIPFNELVDWSRSQKDKSKHIVATNGCFDILHPGHIRYLRAARALGDCLIVGLNSDASVQSLKGPNRPINPEADRAEVLAALEMVDAVTIFPEMRATHFLKEVSPDIYVKGGDYKESDLDQDEVAAVRSCGGRIEILPLVPGKSTTNIVNRMKVPSK